MQAIFQILLTCGIIAVAEAHSQMTLPQVRTLRSELRWKGMTPLALIRPDGFHPKPGQQLKVGSDNFLVTEDDFACRGGARGKPTATLIAGSNYNIKVKSYAPHPGDLAVYASYDTDDKIKDVDKKWHLIYKKTEALCCKCNDPASRCKCDYPWKNAIGKNVCSFYPGPVSLLGAHPTWDLHCSRGCEQERTITVPIPAWMPGGDSVILRYESYAIHLRDPSPGHPSGGHQIEIYATCADVKVVPSPSSVAVSALASVNIRRAQHLPRTNTAFPSQVVRIRNEGPTPGDVFPPLACTGACLKPATSRDPTAITTMVTVASTREPSAESTRADMDIVVTTPTKIGFKSTRERSAESTRAYVDSAENRTVFITIAGFLVTVIVMCT